MTNAHWHGRPYYSLDAYCKNTYGRKLFKTALDAGMTCPNRDGTLGTRGCIFCSAGGSGDFALKLPNWKIQSASPDTIAYFQAYTNTYAPIPVLRSLYREALDRPDVAGVSIATRPDCLAPEVLGLLAELREQYGSAGKFIWVELGLQTIHDRTAEYIRRGYSLSCFEEAVYALHSAGVQIIVHIILGLPGETAKDVVTTIRYLNTLPLFGIKLQLLHVLKGTDLAYEYAHHKFETLSMDDYIRLLISCVEQMNPETVIHRLTGDGPKELLIAPVWSLDKRKVLNTFHHEMKLRNSYQGKKYDAGSFNAL